MHPVEQLRDDALREIEAASDEQALEATRIKYLGKSGSISAWGEQMKTLAKEEKPIVGKLLNEVRNAVTAAIESRTGQFRSQKESGALSEIDVTLPGIGRSGYSGYGGYARSGAGGYSGYSAKEIGSLHPLTQMLERSIQIFRRMGFALADGPDVEDEWHCFDALNMPPEHPARNEQDTFYLSDGRLLRTHTSTVQIRAMESAPPPLRVIAPGAAYRRDEIDATHSAQFHQIEGLYVDENVSVADLKGTLEFFMRELFGPDTEVQFRPHYFPFTEPSLEISVKWLREFVDLPKNPEEIADLLTRAGVETENIEMRGAKIDKMIVSQITASSRHPNADRLTVCEVDDGSGTKRQIVCGATNYKVGDKVPLALPGAKLPNGTEIRKSKLRGVESEGMLCSPIELGLGSDASGLLILPPEAKIGAPISDLFPGDTILDVEITPNRGDLLSHFGLAREIAALTGKKLRAKTRDAKIETRKTGVAITAPRECPFFSARRIDNGTVEPGPQWLRAEIESVGIRSI